MYVVYMLPLVVVVVYFLTQIYRDVQRGAYGWASFGAVAIVLVFRLASAS